MSLEGWLLVLPLRRGLGGCRIVPLPLGYLKVRGAEWGLKAACCGRLLCISPRAAESASCVPQLWQFDEMSHCLFKVPRAWVSLQSLVLVVGSTQGSSLRDALAPWLLAGSVCELRQLQLDWHCVSPCCFPCAGQLEGHCLPSAFTCPQEMCLLVCLER